MLGCSPAGACRRVHAVGMKRSLALVPVLLFALAACGDGDGAEAKAGGPAEQSGPSLRSTYDACISSVQQDLTDAEVGGEATSTELLDLAEDGASLQVSNGTGHEGLAFLTAVAVSCVLDELGAPSSVSAKMDQTRALDGTQSDEWGGFEVSWTYHPDNGLGAVFTED